MAPDMIKLNATLIAEVSSFLRAAEAEIQLIRTSLKEEALISEYVFLKRFALSKECLQVAEDIIFDQEASL